MTSEDSNLRTTSSLSWSNQTYKKVVIIARHKSIHPEDVVMITFSLSNLLQDQPGIRKGGFPRARIARFLIRTQNPQSDYLSSKYNNFLFLNYVPFSDQIKAIKYAELFNVYLLR